MKISLFVVIGVSIFLLLVGGTAWIGVERVEGRFEINHAGLDATKSAEWVTALDDVHRPLAEANVAALLKMSTTMGRALWVIKTLGACLVVSAVCLLVLGVQRLRQIGDARVKTADKEYTS
jgi:hypothetical protein